MNTEQSLTKARIQLLLEKCFYGNLALSLKLVQRDEVGTFATNGKVIYYNKEFADSLMESEREWVLCHEILHNVFYHQSRRAGREPRRWNMAGDFAVNSILNKEFGFIPEGALYKQEFSGMTAEQIYNKLPDMNKPQAQPQSGGQEKGQNQAQGQGQEPKEGDSKPQGKGSGNTKPKQNKRYENSEVQIEETPKGDLKVNGQKIRQFDNHQDIEGSKEEVDELEKDWKIRTTKSFEQSKIAGKLPGGMDIFIKDLLQPKLDWRSLLRQYVNSIAKSDYRWLPSNKRYIHRGLYLPSLSSESLGDVVVIVDNSGSTLQYQKRFFAEVNSILAQYDMNLHLIVCDTEVKSYKVYHKGEELDKEYRGGGGTDLRVAFDFIRQQYINPSVVVCLTDAYTPFPAFQEYATLWVITEGGDIDKVPFGEKVEVCAED